MTLVEVPNFKTVEDLGIVSIEQERRPSQNLLWYITTESGNFYLKSFSGILDSWGYSSEEKIESELMAAQMVKTHAGTETPVCQFLGKSEAGQAFLLESEVVGIPFDEVLSSTEISLDDKHELARQSGQILAKIHQIKASAFGAVSDNNEARFQTWRECFALEIDTLLSIALQRGILSERQSRYFVDLLSDQVLQDPKAEPVLCHRDYTPQNIITNPISHKVVGIVDFEVAKFWIPEWDIARIKAFYDYPQELQQYFSSIMQGYAETLGHIPSDFLKKVDFYLKFEKLYYWLWGWGKNEYKEHIHDEITALTAN